MGFKLEFELRSAYSRFVFKSRHVCYKVGKKDTMLFLRTFDLELGNDCEMPFKVL